ncbi:hypothetical protein EYY60_20490 [Flavobacterium zhairuonense]|uniref:hypothetical protein n=1 Tax=Flavobacterium zhairuonense TaxID=2493631 RepID=UPI0013C2FAC5|nr:hypothetical protein [Flavobacterium zhairuonense]KAF2506895.1 hypothetical protein EYY60_20490 [Flavobacterium zhairuonense]
MKKQVKKFEVTKFEVLQAKGELKGGFSVALTTAFKGGSIVGPANNCHGGNCVAGCSE